PPSTCEHIISRMTLSSLFVAVIALFQLRPRSPLFPYTTLFRSLDDDRRDLRAPRRERGLHGLGIIKRKDQRVPGEIGRHAGAVRDRKSTRLNSSHVKISYAVFCLKKKKRYLFQLSHLIDLCIIL